MTEKRLLQKITALQELISAKRIEAPISSTGFCLPIDKLLADKIITSVFEKDDLNLVFEKKDDALVLHIEQIHPEGTITCTECDGSGIITKQPGKKKTGRRKRSDENLTPADFDLFAYFMAERHQIYRKRFEDNSPPPWTKDEVLQQYRFCNVFRELDAGTIWMRENLTTPNEDKPWSQMIANCGYYRMFNLIATGEFLGWVEEWDIPATIKKLAQRQTEGHVLFTSAHVVRGEQGIPKIATVCNSIGDLYQASERIAEIAAEKQTLQSVYEELIKIRSIGGFVAYEIVTDLRHTPVLRNATDTMTWAHVGPGASRGLKRLGYNVFDGIQAMIELLEKSPAALPDEFPPLELRDIEHSLCDFDKYCRVKFNEEGRRRPFKPAS